MATILKLIGVALAALVCGLPYLLYGAESPPVALTWATLILIAAGLTLWHPAGRLQTAFAVGSGLLFVVTVQILVDLSQDPTSHNLWPFEIVIAFAFGILPALLGAFLGGWASRKAPWPRTSGSALIALALILATVSALVTAPQIARTESLTLKRVEALIGAQHRFRAAQPHRGFTCDLAELDEPFRGPIKSSSAPYRVGQIVYRIGTTAIQDEYIYMLRCEKKPDPQDAFILTASPDFRSPVKRRGRWTFCAGPDGVIRSTERGRLYSCFTEGQTVQHAVGLR